ncbi:hypothetical protein ACROYT_G001226 [Oculina patagonica]
MEDARNIGESLSPKDSQINDIMSSPEENNATKAVGSEDGFKDKKTSFTENESREEKPDEQESLENGTDILDPVSNEEKTETSETSSEILNELITKEQSTTETPNRNSLESGELENLSTNNIEEEENASSAKEGLNSQETNLLEVSHSHSEIKGSPKSSSADHDHGSHRSPDRKSKDEYRKIKSEVTGEGETSESEGEEKDSETGTRDSDESKDTWMDMLGNGLLKKRVLREGKGRDTRPDKGQRVTIQAAGRTEDGTGVDWNSSLEFILGEGEVIQAFDLAIALMELDEVCELVTDPRYAYGQTGKPEANPPIPPDAKLTYEIQLLAIRDGPNINTMSDEDRMNIGEKKREMGNSLYTAGDYAGAINSYQRAIKYLGSSTSKEIQELRVKCWNNMAAAQLKIKAFTAAEKSCSQVLQVDPDNVKALFRKGKVLAASGDTDQALGLIKKADQLDPSNQTIRKELNRLRQLLASEKRSERSMYRRMVGDLAGKGSKKKNRAFLGWPLVFGATVVALGGILITIYLSRH